MGEVKLPCFQTENIKKNNNNKKKRKYWLKVNQLKMELKIDLDYFSLIKTGVQKTNTFTHQLNLWSLVQRLFPIF